MTDLVDQLRRSANDNVTCPTHCTLELRAADRIVGLRRLVATLIWVILLCIGIFSYQAFACTAFYKGEWTSGMNKICLYDHLGSDVAITIDLVELCPITIEARH